MGRCGGREGGHRSQIAVTHRSEGDTRSEAGGGRGSDTFWPDCATFQTQKGILRQREESSDAEVELGPAGPSPAIWLPIHQVSDTFPPALDKDMHARKRRKP